MLKDEDLLPICRRWAHRFLRQGLMSGGDKKDVFNELVNVGYATAKPLTSIDNASKWIMWMLARYVNAHPDTKLAGIDRRTWMRSTAPSPLEVAQMKEERERLVRAVASLDEEDRIIICAYYKGDKTLKDVGQMIGLTGAPTWYRMQKALIKLRAMMR